MHTIHTENLNHKEVKIKKIAYFKENLRSDEIEFLSLIDPKFETIYNLTSKQDLKLKLNFSTSLTEVNSYIECSCNGLCKYTKSNLNILFYHK
jgi:hypothetical protein